jgi:IQ calmodulin-binding motif
MTMCITISHYCITLHTHTHALHHYSNQLQGALRTYAAKQLARRLRTTKAAAYIQRVYRGWRGRLVFLVRLRRAWAAALVQRNWRGHSSRKWFAATRAQAAAAGVCVCAYCTVLQCTVAVVVQYLCGRSTCSWSLVLRLLSSTVQGTVVAAAARTVVG